MRTDQINVVLVIAIASWFLAQVIKTLLYFITSKKFCAERLTGAGGMPSAHSACVCSTAMATCRVCGICSVEFALAMILAIVVMYDATGVRRAAGLHAKEINKLRRVVNELDEEYMDMLEQEESENIVIDNAESIPEIDGIDLDPAIVEFWGTGFEPSFYLELDRKYKYWTSGLPKTLDKGEEAIYKQVCILEATINRDSAAGKSIEKNVNALNTLLGSANLKPSQKKADDAAETAFDGMPFGVGIRMYENSRPIPQPDPEFQDVDGIVRYISIWFLGHLCKMLGIKNTYCKMYEKELEKMRIDNPELDEEDDEALFEDIFGGET